MNWNRYQAEYAILKKKRKKERKKECGPTVILGDCDALKYIEESFIMVSVWHLVYCIVLLMGYI